MSKKQLQKDIRANGGFILSDGTCNLQHLLPKAHDLIVEYRLRGARHGIGDLLTSIRECFILKRPADAKRDMWTEQYHGRAEPKQYRHGDIALDPTDVWCACVDFFDSIAPKGYYFGASAGDGACFGWFKYESEE